MATYETQSWSLRKIQNDESTAALNSVMRNVLGIKIKDEIGIEDNTLNGPDIGYKIRKLKRKYAGQGICQGR